MSPPDPGSLPADDRWVQTLLETANDAFVAMDAQGRITAWNRAAEVVFGWPRAEALGKRLSETIIPPALREAHERGMQRYLATGEGPVLRRTLEVTALRRDGTEFPVELTIWPVGTGGAVSFNAFARDITERKRAEEALAESEERHRALFDRSPVPMWLTDQETLGFLEVNAAAVAQYGWTREEFLRLTMQDLQPGGGADDSVDARLEVRSATGSLHNLVRHRTKGGAVLEVETAMEMFRYRGRPAWLVTAMDVTERRHLEEKLRQSQKLEAVGALAGGVAHDFNNILVAILGFGDLALAGLETGHPSRRHVEEILKAGDRAAALTKQLLAFSRKQGAQMKVLDLNEVVRGMEKMLRLLAGERIDLAIETEPGLGRVRADRGQMEQVLLNLVVNARDAMPEGGRIVVRTKNVSLDGHRGAVKGAPGPGRFATVAVEDTGSGFDEDTAEHLFEPFFTTKPSGKGTGLGLATVHGIVHQHRGGVGARSTPGAGATFEVFLPLVPDGLAAGEPEAAPGDAPEAAAGGTGTILLAEDDPTVRSMAAEVLRSRGYVILESTNGLDALEVARGCGRTIDLLLTDVVMPGLGGGPLAARIREMHPAAKILFMTGYPVDPATLCGGDARGAVLLRKPFVPAELARRVAELLAASG